MTRGKIIRVSPNKQEHLNYLRKHYTEEMENAADDEDRAELAGRLGIATALLTSVDPEFKYDTDKEEAEHDDEDMFQPLTYRTLKLALDDCDGTKDDFLEVWPEFINEDKLPMAEAILRDYVDVKDKANSVFDEFDAEADDDEGDGDFGLAGDDLMRQMLGHLDNLEATGQI